MAATAYYLTEDEIKLLQGLLDRSGKGIRNVDRQRSQTQWDEHEAYQTPECHIAFPVDKEGIPGLKYGDEKSWNVGEGDISGFALADIYSVFDGKLKWLERSELVMNLSEGSLRGQWFTVQRTKFGPWIAKPQFVVVDGILDQDLDAAEGPLTEATVSYVRLIEWMEKTQVNEGEEWQPDKWRASSRKVRLINRSVNFHGTVGTYGVFGKLGSEFRVISLDCDRSEEGVHEVVKANERDSESSMGSGSLGG